MRRRRLTCYSLLEATMRQERQTAAIPGQYARGHGGTKPPPELWLAHPAKEVGARGGCPLNPDRTVNPILGLIGAQRQALATASPATGRALAMRVATSRGARVYAADASSSGAFHSTIRPAIADAATV